MKTGATGVPRRPPWRGRLGHVATCQVSGSSVSRYGSRRFVSVSILFLLF